MTTAPMLKLIPILFFLVCACVAIHGAGMVFGIRRLRHAWPRLASDLTLPDMFWLTRVVFGLLLLHLLQIVVWALAYHWSGCFPDFVTSFYYSATSYSTAGYGDVSPPGNWRVLGALEAVTGILMFGWSTGVLFAVVHHLHSHFFKPPASPHHPQAEGRD